MLLHRDEDVVQVPPDLLRDMIDRPFDDPVEFFFADSHDTSAQSTPAEFALRQQQNGKKNEASTGHNIHGVNDGR
jgi:hypothetical protein